MYIHTYILLTYSAEFLSVQCETSSNLHDFREKQQDPLGAEKTLSCEEWSTLFTLQWSGHNQSVYVNEKIKKENGEYLFSPSYLVNTEK